MSMNAIHTYGVVTNNPKLARDTLINISNDIKDVERISLSEHNMYITFKNGVSWMWIKPIDSNRGYRLHKAMFDKNITLEDLSLSGDRIVVYIVMVMSGFKAYEITLLH